MSTTSAPEQDMEAQQNDAKAFARQGEQHRLMGRYDDALVDFGRAIEQKPDYAWALARRGETYRVLGRYEDALADFNRAIALEPEYVWAIAHRGAVYDTLRRLSEALADLDRAIELKPDYAWAMIHRMRVLGKLRRYDEMLAEFERAMALDESVILDPLPSERGLLNSFVHRYAESIAHYQERLREHPQDCFARYGVVVAEVVWKGREATQARIDEVRQFLLSMLDEPAARPEALYGLSGLAALEDKRDEAFHYLQQAIALIPYRMETSRHDLAWRPLHNDPRYQELDRIHQIL